MSIKNKRMELGRPKYWTDELKKNAIDIVLHKISEESKSLRSILDSKRDKKILPSRRVFNEWLSEDANLSTQYAHACELRAENIFDDILDIADDTSRDKRVTDAGEVADNEVIQRSRLRVDARKWYLSKLSPKKYGDKLDVTTDGEKINSQPPIFGNNPLDGQ